MPASGLWFGILAVASIAPTSAGDETGGPISLQLGDVVEMIETDELSIEFVDWMTISAFQSAKIELPWLETQDGFLIGRLALDQAAASSLQTLGVSPAHAELLEQWQSYDCDLPISRPIQKASLLMVMAIDGESASGAFPKVSLESGAPELAPWDVLRFLKDLIEELYGPPEVSPDPATPHLNRQAIPIRSGSPAMSRRNNIPCDNITRVWRTGTPPPHLSCTLAGHLELTSADSASDQWDMSIVSQRVAWLCAPYTYSSIAEPLRMNAETVRRMVRGLQQPSSEMLIRLCIYGRVSQLADLRHSPRVARRRRDCSCVCPRSIHAPIDPRVCSPAFWTARRRRLVAAPDME
ncbi:MAG: hypothetical protein R3B46_03315 [Phycisphaerales bacterium]